MTFQINRGQISILIDGGFGSTGKGLLAGWIASNNKIDIAVTNASSNAGHTVIKNGIKKISRHIPIAALIQPDCEIHLCAGSVIDPEVLLEEIKRFDLKDRISIHPRAAIIDKSDKKNERKRDKYTTRTASTQKGVGAALARKVLRENPLAEGTPELSKYIKNLELRKLMDTGSRIFMEVPQGMDLGINGGLEYPYVTSREVSVSQALSDAIVHPKYLGSVAMTFRTFPIRVGNIPYENDKEKLDPKFGWSGPFWPDSFETSWDAIGVEAETTTVTGRVRRVATFSARQFINSIEKSIPDLVFINFMNYLRDAELKWFIDNIPVMVRRVSPSAEILWGYGPDVNDIKGGRGDWI